MKRIFSERTVGRKAGESEPLRKADSNDGGDAPCMVLCLTTERRMLWKEQHPAFYRSAVGCRGVGGSCVLAEGFRGCVGIGGAERRARIERKAGDSLQEEADQLY